MSITINDEIFNTLSSALKYIEEEGLNIKVSSLGDIFEKNGELVELDIVNSENPQHLVMAYIDINDVKYEKAKKELTITSRYHSWSNTVAYKVKVAVEKSDNQSATNLNTDLLEQYNQLVIDYNGYFDLSLIRQGMSANEIFTNFLQN